MNNLNNYHKIIFFVLSFILILILIYGGSRHDYNLYTLTWESFINNEKEIPYNSYGPVHLILSLIYKFHFLAPKIFFGLSFILVNYYIFNKILKKNNPILLIYFYITIPCNFLIISYVFFYGINDSLVAFFFIISIILLLNQRFILSSVFISLATLLKIYPILFFPQFLFINKKESIKIFLTTLFFITIFLFLFSVLYDYRLLLEPISFGSNRDPKFASIISSLNYSFPENPTVEFLKKYNTYFIIISVVIVHIFTLLKKTDFFYSIILVYMVILITYKVGSPHFYIPLMVILSFLLTLDEKYLIIFKILLPLIFLLSLTVLGYSLTAGYDIMKISDFPWFKIRENIGYVFFVTNLYVLIKMFFIFKKFINN